MVLTFADNGQAPVLSLLAAFSHARVILRWTILIEFILNVVDYWTPNRANSTMDVLSSSATQRGL